MRAVLQRVTEARVMIDDEIVGEIGPGLLVFVAVHRDDSESEASRLASKILRLRVFPDTSGKMNLNVTEFEGSLLVVSQFTLYGETRKGNRPSFDNAAAPVKAQLLYDFFVSICRSSGVKTATGRFQAHMRVQLVNDGPVTILCDSES